MGSETPRLFTPPARPLTPETTRGYEAITFATDVLGLDLMPWQRWLLLHLLELTEAGAYRFRVALVLCGRQGGKSTLLQVLALWRLYVDRAGLVLGSAQTLALAEEVWDGAVSMAEGVPELAAEVDQVVRVNGDKTLRLTTGERYKVAAASRKGGRGLSSDLVLLDELREHHTWDAWGAITKTTMARPSPQVLGFSNAGDGRSVVLADLREKALAAVEDPTTSLGLFEWSAPDDCALDDPVGWAAANPALGHRMSADAIRSALQTDPEDVFRTEVLCQWVAASASAFSPSVWEALLDGTAPRGSSLTFAADVAPDHSTATLAVAWRRPDGAAQVQLAHAQEGVEGFAAQCTAIAQRWSARLIVEQSGTAGYLLPELERSTTVEKVSRKFYADACSALDAAVSARQVRHGGQESLTAAVVAARWSTSTTAGPRVLSRRDPRVSPLVAAALALHGLSLPEPRRGGWVMAV